MCGDEPGGFGNCGPVGKVREAQHLVAHGVMPRRGRPSSAAERVPGAGVNGGTAESAGGGPAKNRGTNADPDSQDKVARLEAGPVGGVQRPQPGVVVVRVPELPEQPRSSSVPTDFKPLDGVDGVAVVTDLAQPPLDGLVPFGLNFVVLVARWG